MTTAVPALGRATRVRRSLAWYAPTVVVFIALVVGWELLVGSLAMRVAILPAPSAIVAALGENWSGGRWPLLESTLSTLFEAVGGLLIGTLVGVLVAFVVARWTSAREAVLPVAVAVNAIPIIAAAPLMNNWFGVTSPVSKMMLAAMLVFFPVMINVTRGLSQVEPAAVELMRSYAASEWEILRKVRLPNALPFFLTALKLGTTLSLIGAIVGEYFGGSSTVLGRVVVQSASALRFDVTWAAILLAAIAGILFYLAVSLLERALIPWHASVRVEQPG